MRYALALVAAATTVVASPAPQAVDFGAILAAPAPSLTGPPIKASQQTSVYNGAAATASAAAAVTAVASASATASLAARGLDARELHERSFCFFGFCWGVQSSSSSPSSTTAAPKATQAPLVDLKVTSVLSAAVAAITGPVYAAVPTICTPVSWTNTFEFTTETGCAAPFEVGTYCGFINPEDPCAPQPAGSGPSVNTPADTPEAFLAYADFHKTAKNAKAPTGYVATFTDLNATVNANSYMGLHTLTSYDVNTCAAKCDATDLCTSFNIYIERDPAWNPEQCSCDTPNSITNYKCTLWGSGVEAAAATNFGQTRDGTFSVVVTGSNGYSKTNTTTPATPVGWTNPQTCSGKTHDHPSTCMGQKFFPGPYNPSVCGAYALAQNAKNTQSSMWSMWSWMIGYSPLKCNFINSYMIKKDGVPLGTHCKLFTQQYQPQYAQYIPGWSGKTYWGVETSHSFCLKN